MTAPRPSRRARWTIGLSLVALFATVTLGATVVALVQVAATVDSTSAADDSDGSEGSVDSTAQATIIDVDVYDENDEVVRRTFDREGGWAGYAEVDIQFTNNGRSPDGELTSVAWMSWPDDLDLPLVGSTVGIEYDSSDPEYRPQLIGTEQGEPRPIVDQAFSGSETEDDDEAPAVSAPVRWTIAGSGSLALISLIATVIWARRAEPAPGRSGDRPPLGQPAWPGPSSWNQGQPTWGQPAWGQPTGDQPNQNPAGPSQGHPDPAGPGQGHPDPAGPGLVPPG